MECEYAQQMARAEAGQVEEGEKDTNGMNTRSVEDEENTQVCGCRATRLVSVVSSHVTPVTTLTLHCPHGRIL